MLPALLATANDPARRGLFWAGLAALVIAQLAALWMLCNHQVAQAQARQAGVRTEQVALAECLQHVPGATLATCTGGADAGASVPVGYIYQR